MTEDAAGTRTLMLMRHSKAEHVAGTRDVDRELTDRGRRDATAAGQWLAERGLVPDVVLCSSSARTRQTFDGVAAGGAGCDDVRYDERIYNGSAGALLQAIGEVTDDCHALLVIGHAPGVPWLADALADGSAGPQQAREQLDAGFPTSAIAVLQVDAPWAELSAGTAVLTDLVVPRD